MWKACLQDRTTVRTKNWRDDQCPSDDQLQVQNFNQILLPCPVGSVFSFLRRSFHHTLVHRQRFQFGHLLRSNEPVRINNVCGDRVCQLLRTRKRVLDGLDQLDRPSLVHLPFSVLRSKADRQQKRQRPIRSEQRKWRWAPELYSYPCFVHFVHQGDQDSTSYQNLSNFRSPLRAHFPINDQSFAVLWHLRGMGRLVCHVSLRFEKQHPRC